MMLMDVFREEEEKAILSSVMAGGKNWGKYNKPLLKKSSVGGCLLSCPGINECIAKGGQGPDGKICSKQWDCSSLTVKNLAVVDHVISEFAHYDRGDLPASVYSLDGLVALKEKANELLLVILKIRGKPSKTEVQRLANTRNGQSEFREQLRILWGKCPISRIDNPFLLRASHIKPWSECDDFERLDYHNGILLGVHVDAAFDRGLWTIDASTYDMILSNCLSAEDAKALCLKSGKAPVSIRSKLKSEHKPYLEYHNNYCFREG